MSDDQTKTPTETEDTTQNADELTLVQPADEADVADSGELPDDATLEALTAPEGVDGPLETTEETASAPTDSDAETTPADAPTLSPADSTEAATSELPEDPAADEVIEAPEPVGDDSLPGTPAETDLLAEDQQSGLVADEPVEETEPASEDAGSDENVAQPLDGEDIQLAPTPEAPVLEALANSESEDVGKPVPDEGAKIEAEQKDTSSVVLPSLIADEEGAPVNLEEQPAKEDIVAQRPLTSQVVEETRGAHDAVPDEAQKHMASFRPFLGDKRDPGPGQLPGNDAFAGTQEDATGVSQSLPTLAHFPGAELDPLTEDGTELSAVKKAEPAGSDEATDGGSEDSESETASTGETSESGSEGEDDDIFGEPRTEILPLFDLAGDGLGDIKKAAKAGQSAVSALSQVPLHLLEVEHRDHIYRLKQIIGELLTLTGALFKRNG